MKLIAMLLLIALIFVTIDDVRAHRRAKNNDEAATECAIRTGFKYNCSDGSQRTICD